jgi:hypothetical protein
MENVEPPMGLLANFANAHANCAQPPNTAVPQDVEAAFAALLEQAETCVASGEALNPRAVAVSGSWSLSFGIVPKEIKREAEGIIRACSREMLSSEPEATGVALALEMWIGSSDDVTPSTDPKRREGILMLAATDGRTYTREYEIERDSGELEQGPGRLIQTEGYIFSPVWASCAVRPLVSVPRGTPVH